MKKRDYERPAISVVAIHKKLYPLMISGEISGYSNSSNGFSQDDEEPIP